MLQHDKIWGDNPPLRILGGFVPTSPRDLRPCSQAPSPEQRHVSNPSDNCKSNLYNNQLSRDTTHRNEASAAKVHLVSL